MQKDISLPQHHCHACGQAIPLTRALTNPQLTAVAEPAPGAVLQLAHLAAALTVKFGRTYTTKNAGRLVRSLGIATRETRVNRKGLTCIEGYRLRV